MSDTPGWTGPDDARRDSPGAAGPPGAGAAPGGDTATPPAGGAAGAAGAGQPGWGQPGWGQPAWGQPGWGQPAWGQPAWGQPGSTGYGGYGQPGGWGGGEAGWGGQGGQPGWGQGGQPGWGGWGAWRPENKPGVVALRPLGIGEVLDGAITTIRNYPKATLGLSAIVMTLATVLTSVSQMTFLRSLEDMASRPETASFPVAGLSGFLLSALVSALATAVLTGILTVVVGKAVLGQPITLGEAWRAARPRLGAIIGASVLTALLYGVAIVLCILPIIWVGPMLSLGMPALMLERQRVTDALRRSWRLVGADFWRVLLILFLSWLILYMIQMAIAMPFTIAGTGAQIFVDPTAESLGIWYFVLTGIGTAIAATVVTPIRAAIRVLLYVDLRIRQEGLDVTLAAAAAQAAAGPSPQPVLG